MTASARLCPYCAELVAAAAIKCKHCGSNIGSPSARDGRMRTPTFSGSNESSRFVAGMVECPQCGRVFPIHAYTVREMAIAIAAAMFCVLPGLLYFSRVVEPRRRTCSVCNIEGGPYYRKGEVNLPSDA